MKGYNNREIAAELYIAEGTVRNYISNLYRKLDVVDRVQAIVRLQAL
ncbi:LuxR C-terminal-related transcriptional regulator [Brevibacillus invocatus]